MENGPGLGDKLLRDRPPKKETPPDPESRPTAPLPMEVQQPVAQPPPGIWALSAQFVSPKQVYNFAATDLLSSLEQPIGDNLISSRRNLFRRDARGTMEEILHFANFKQNLLIFASSACMTVLAFFANFVGDLILKYKFIYTRQSVWLSGAVAIAAVLLTTHPCASVPFTEGSGMSELKLSMTGTPCPNFLTGRVFLVKVWGLVWGKVAGVGVGGFATLFHLSACLTDLFFELPYFRSARSDHAWRVALLATMTAGPNIIFYSPLGSIFFALEYFGTTIKLCNLFPLVLAATTSYFFTVLMSVIFSVSRMPAATLPDYPASELYHFAVMGVLCAVLARFFMAVCSKWVLLKRRSTLTLFTNRYVYCSAVALLLILVTYQHSFFATSEQKVMLDFFSVQDFALEKSFIAFWHADSPGRFLLEFLYLLLTRVLMLAAILTMPLPGGVFGAGLVIGVTAGRFYGELARYLLGCRTPPTAFALSGGASFICCLTRSFSPILFVLEFSRNFNFILPNLVSVVAAHLVSSTLNIGFFEMMTAIRRLPSLLAVLPPEQLRQSAGEIARPVELALSEEQGLLALFDFFLRGDLSRLREESNAFVPFVSSASGAVIGYASVAACLRFTRARLGELNRSTKTPDALRAKAEHLLALDAKHTLSASDPAQRLLVSNLRVLFGLEEVETRRLRGQIGSEAKLEICKEDFRDVFAHDLKGLRKFLKQVRIKLDHPLLELQENHVTVPAHMLAAKVQLMFIGLRVSVVWVQHPSERKLMYISLKDFLNYKFH